MTQSALWLKTGDVEVQLDVEPANGKTFTLEELQGFVAGEGPGGKSKTITIVILPSGMALVANDDGKLIGLPYNEAASKIWRAEFPKEKYPLNNDGILVGNVLLCSKKQAGY